MHLYWEYLILKSFLFAFSQMDLPLCQNSKTHGNCEASSKYGKNTNYFSFHGGFDLDLCLFAQCDGGLYL